MPYFSNTTFVKKSLIMYTAILGGMLIYFVWFTNFRNELIILDKYQSANLNNSEKSDTKYVLYWSPFWNTWDYQLGYGYEPFKNCEFSNCFATKDRSLLPLEKYDALIFHATYNKKQHGSPWVRAPHQRYIFMNWEAPVYICPYLKQYNSYFNWTMSYRFDSDIVRRHGYIFKEKTNYTMPSVEFLKMKTNLAAWMVSNCKTPSHREDLGKEIQKFMKVDVYGFCGTMGCQRKKGNEKISSPECYDMIEKKYKFYFSFENSYCKDYSTEKLYNLLLKNVVPVVYGFGDYNLSAPPHSVINVADFESVEKLIDYLRYLNKNVSEYLKYFEWKKNYRVTRSLESSACQICKKLHEPIKQSIYYDLHEWWWGRKQSMCKIGKTLPKIVSDIVNQ